MPDSGRIKPLVLKTSAWLLMPLLCLLGFLVKRDHEQWLIITNHKQRFDGNLRAMFDYLWRCGSRKPVLLNGADHDPVWLDSLYPGITVCNEYGISSLRWRLQAGIYVFSNGPALFDLIYGKISRRRLLNIWHGIPLKGVGNLDTGMGSKRHKLLRRLHKNHYMDAFTVSSSNERAVMAGCFLLDAEKIKVTGISRNDWLLQPIFSLPADMRTSLEEIENRKRGRKLILYAPTLRDYDRNATGFGTDDTIKLDALLKKHNAVMGLRAHPRDNALIMGNFTDLSDHLINLSYEVIPEVATLLRATDILVTDYSSLWVDFLLLKRQIIGYVYDFDTYLKSRGLVYNYKAVFPGQLCYDSQQFLKCLDASLSGETVADESAKRQWLTDFFHTHQDGRAGERIYQLMQKSEKAHERSVQNFPKGFAPKQKE